MIVSMNDYDGENKVDIMYDSNFFQKIVNNLMVELEEIVNNQKKQILIFIVEVQMTPAQNVQQKVI